MDSETNLEKTMSIVKNYVIPSVALIASIAIAWSILNNTVTQNTQAIEHLEVRCDKNEQVVQLILERLASIDTKLEYIVKEIDK